MKTIEPRLLKVELAKQGLTRVDLSRRMRIPYSTLSAWIHQVSPAPTNLAERIEHVLGLAPGSVSAPNARAIGEFGFLAPRVGRGTP